MLKGGWKVDENDEGKDKTLQKKYPSIPVFQLKDLLY